MAAPGVRSAKSGANPGFDSSPALAFAMHPGAELDPRAFSHRRHARGPPVAGGPVAPRAHRRGRARCAPDLADLRVVDADRRQWPYLLEQRVAERRRDSAWRPPSRASAARSRYELALPAAPLRVDERSRSSSDVAVLRPAVRADPRRRRTAPSAARRTARLAKQARARGPPRSRSPAGAASPRSSSRIDDGDDAPLALRAARARRRCFPSSSWWRPGRRSTRCCSATPTRRRRATSSSACATWCSP